MNWKLFAAVAGLLVCLPGLAVGQSAGEAPVVDPMLGPLAEVPCTPEATAGGIRCVAGDQPVFEFHHPALYSEPDRYRNRRGGTGPVEPVEFGDAHYYGVENELFRFDVDRRALTGRVRFPAPIADLEAAESGLRVDIEAPPHRTGPPGPDTPDGETVTVDYDPESGEAPGRGPWNWTGTLGPLHDAMWLEGVPLGAEPGESGLDYETDPADDRRAIRSLTRRERIDRTNPYLPLYRGEARIRLGEPEAARTAFEEAVEHPEADWIDLLRIGWRFELHGRTDLADRAFERAHGLMDETGVRGEYVTAMMNAGMAFVWLPQGLGGAVEAGDVETAGRLARRLRETFPKLEGAPAARERLAAFFEEAGHDEKADRFREQADEIRELDDRPDRFFEETARAVDLYLMLQIGLLVAALLAGAIVGLRRYEENDEAAESGDEGSGWKEYLPRYNPVDLVMVGAVFAVLVVLPAMVAPHVQSMTTLAEAPPAASGDAVAAPAVHQWADGLAESRPRDELIAEGRAELEATREGTVGPGELDLNAALVEAVEADTRARQIRRLADVEASEQATEEFGWLRPLMSLEFDTRALVLLVVVLGLNALIFGALLQAAARRIEPVGRIGRTVVPGGPNSLGVFRIPVLASFCVGVMLMTPFSRNVQLSTESSLVGLYGLQDAPVGLESSLPAIGFGLVVVSLIVHAVGVVRDRHAVDDGRQPGGDK